MVLPGAGERLGPPAQPARLTGRALMGGARWLLARPELPPGAPGRLARPELTPDAPALTGGASCRLARLAPMPDAGRWLASPVLACAGERQAPLVPLPGSARWPALWPARWLAEWLAR